MSPRSCMFVSQEFAWKDLVRYPQNFQYFWPVFTTNSKGYKPLVILALSISMYTRLTSFYQGQKFRNMSKTEAKAPHGSTGQQKILKLSSTSIVKTKSKINKKNRISSSKSSTDTDSDDNEWVYFPQLDLSQIPLQVGKTVWWDCFQIWSILPKFLKRLNL